VRVLYTWTVSFADCGKSQVSDIFLYNADSPLYYYNYSPPHIPGDLSDLGIPPALPSSASPVPSSALFSASLETLADTSADAAPLSPAPPSPALAYPSPSPAPELHFPDPPDSPINYDRVAPGLENSPEAVFQETLRPGPISVEVERPLSHVPSPPPRSPRPLSPLPPTENARLEEQENRIPAFYRCPDQTQPHPHQYIAVRTPRGNERRPYRELSFNNPLVIPSLLSICEAASAFPTVTPFRVRPLHNILITPANQLLAAAFNIPNLTVCCKAIRYLPSIDIPHGYIKYSFSSSLAAAFTNHSQLIKNAFTGAITLLEVYDFLDGRIITAYGYLEFGEEGTFVTDLGYHCEDIIRTHPFLLSYCFTPRIPADPLAHISVLEDDCPLVAT
jgi:hypothetical protein